MLSLVTFGAIFFSSASACQAAWAQCGGQGYSGETCCVSGHACVVVGDWWHSCQPVVGATPAPTPDPTPAPVDPTPEPTPQPTSDPTSNPTPAPVDPTPEPTPQPTADPTSNPTPSPVSPSDVLSGNLMYATNVGAMSTWTPSYITKDTWGDIRESDASKDKKQLTYYAGENAISQTAQGTGACSFSNIQNLEAFDNVDGWVAVSKDLTSGLGFGGRRYEHSMACGMCVQYRGKGGSVGGVNNPIPTTWQKAIVVDGCEACENSAFDKELVEIDLSDNTGDGKWDIEWKSVECDVDTGKFQYTFVSGSSNWAVRLQIRNTKVPIYKVEMKGRKNVDDVTSPDATYEYREMRRADDNHFVANGDYTPDLARNWQRPYGKYVGAVAGSEWGTKEDKLEIRITSIFGEQVEDTIDFTSPAHLQTLSYSTPITGSVQFDDGADFGTRRLDMDLEMIAPHY